jgi:hypothetical protein
MRDIPVASIRISYSSREPSQEVRLCIKRPRARSAASVKLCSNKRPSKPLRSENPLREQDDEYVTRPTILRHEVARLLGARTGIRQWIVEVRDCVGPSETPPYSRGGVMVVEDKTRLQK